MTLPTLDTLLDGAIAAAKAAGNHAVEQIRRRGAATTVSAHDVKLELDVECQIKAREVLHRLFPDHSVMGEEDTETQQKTAAHHWIIDPIDGTVNFSHGLPYWCSSVAVEHEGRTLAGAVFAPEMSELFAAHAEGPALLNGEPIRVSAIDTMKRALMMTDTNKEPYDFPAGAVLYGKLLHRAQKVRVMGAAALDMCRVACGMAEGYTALGIYPWDTAAAALIIERAGGRFEVIEQLGNERFRSICSNSLIHHELKDVFMETLAEFRDQGQ